jgi:cytidylate kinase
MSTSDSAAEQRGDTDETIKSSTSPPSPVVTLAAYYGAGGTVIGPLVAQRLGVTYLDRGIIPAVAAQLHVSEEATASYTESTSGTDRLLGSLARVMIADTPPVARLTTNALDAGLDNDYHRYRAAIDEFLISATESGGVALGRGGYVALHSVAGALHVMLGGPRDARIRQAMELEGIDRQTAERLLGIHDQGRIEFVRSAYGVDPLDPDWFHLRIDSTAIDLDTCVDLIVTASQARLRQAQAV